MPLAAQKMALRRAHESSRKPCQQLTVLLRRDDTHTVREIETKNMNNGVSILLHNKTDSGRPTKTVWRRPAHPSRRCECLKSPDNAFLDARSLSNKGLKS